MKNGVPKGGILGLTLFNVFISNLRNYFLYESKCILYADNLAIVILNDMIEKVYYFIYRIFDIFAYYCNLNTLFFYWLLPFQKSDTELIQVSIEESTLYSQINLISL